MLLIGQIIIRKAASNLGAAFFIVYVCGHLDLSLKNFIFVGKEDSIMPEEILNQYRLTSMEEPTDEMLAQIMHEVAEEAKEKSQEAHRRFFDEIRALTNRLWRQESINPS